MSTHAPKTQQGKDVAVATTPLPAILIASAIAGVATLLATFSSGVTFWFPPQASTVAKEIDWLFNFITWICIFFFVLVSALMIWFCIKYRMRRPTDKAISDVTHNTPLELTWTIIPLILVIAIFYVGMLGYLDLRRPPTGAYEVNVMAQRWSWQFSHRSGVSMSNRLLVPVGRPVKLLMESADVLHAAFIPAFRVKQDIVPGRVTHIWFTATEPGTYDLFCAEYCGKDHSQMHAIVEALPEDQFQARLEEEGRWFEGLADEQLYVLARDKIYPRCASCHSLDDKDGTGPSWRGSWAEIVAGDRVFTDRSSLKDLMGPGKMFETPEDYLQQSILNPQQKIVMNFSGSMPTFKGLLKQQEFIAMRDFIKHLDEFDEQGRPKPGTQAEQTRKQVEEIQKDPNRRKAAKPAAQEPTQP